MPMMRHLSINSSNTSKRRGVALLEFALILPILLLIILGIIEFGWFEKNQLTTANATREGARVASLGRLQTDIGRRVRNSAAPLHVESIKLEYSQDGGSTYTTFPADDTVRNQNTAPVGSLIRVTVQVTHNPLTSLALFRRRIRVEVTMVRERT